MYIFIYTYTYINMHVYTYIYSAIHFSLYLAVACSATVCCTVLQRVTPAPDLSKQIYFVNRTLACLLFCTTE